MDRKLLSMPGFTKLLTVNKPKGLNMEKDTEMMEIILFGDERTKSITKRLQLKEQEKANLQIIELDNRESKMALLRQLKLNYPHKNIEHEDGNRRTRNDKNSSKNENVIAKLPTGTVLIERDNNAIKDLEQSIGNERKPQKRTQEITSNGNKNSGAPLLKINRNQRSSNSRRTAAEVRRNPARESKKNLNKDLIHARQNLLQSRKKRSISSSESRKRVRLSSTPYMNTRSVTRKLYSVGATRQTPSTYDALELKEWPVHGMHERPIFHPEIGLAYEYIGRCFKNLNDSAYEEIIENSESNFINLTGEISNSMNSSCFNENHEKLDDEILKRGNQSIEQSMHITLHLILAFCARLFSSNDYKDIQTKIRNLKTKNHENRKINEEQRKDSYLIKMVNRNDDDDDDNDDDDDDDDDDNDNDNHDYDDSKTDGNGKHIKISSMRYENKDITSLRKNNTRVPNFLAKRSEPTKCLITPRSSLMPNKNNSNSNHTRLQQMIRASQKNSLIIFKMQELSNSGNLRSTNPSSEQITKQSQRTFTLESDDSAIVEKSVSDSKTRNYEERERSVDNDYSNKNKTEKMGGYGENISEFTEELNYSLMKLEKSDKCKMNYYREKFGDSKLRIFDDERIVEKSSIEQHELGCEQVPDSLMTELSEAREMNEEDEQLMDDDCLKNLLETTSILYCAASGISQKSLADYIDTLTTKESLESLVNYSS